MQRWWLDLVLGAVRDRLAELAAEAARDDGPAAKDLGRTVAAWGALLRLHEPGPSGECTRCRRARRWALWVRQSRRGSERRQAGELCTVWQIAVAYFMGGGSQR